MKNYHKDEEIATRDIVARSIETEIRKTIVNYVFLDCSTISDYEFVKHFPNIKKQCENLGLDLSTDSIPVMPAAHFLCGGINTDINGKTNINNLYVCGECANTGLNGANRLASNSLLESLVFSHQCAIDAIIDIKKDIEIYDNVLDKNENKDHFYSLEKIKEKTVEIQKMMSKNIGIFTNNKLLNQANLFMTKMEEDILEIQQKFKVSVALYQLINMIMVCNVIIKQSLERKENKGVFFNTDLK